MRPILATCCRPKATLSAARLLLALAWLLPLAAMAQGNGGKDGSPVEWSVNFVPEGPGGQVTLKASIDPGVHIFSPQEAANGGYFHTRLEVDDHNTQGATLASPLAVRAGELESGWDPIMQDTLRYYHHHVEYGLQLKLPKGKATFAATLVYQHCTEDGRCFLERLPLDLRFQDGQLVN